MHRRSFSSALVVLLSTWCLLSTVTLADDLEQVQVNIANGPLRGRKVSVPGERQPINQFLGIPYAQPPVGKLRFRRPRPIVEKWSEPKDANNWPNGCIQFTEHPFVKVTEKHVKNNNTSEDCLYLQVWSPEVEVASEEKLRPVIVWIHGGGLFVGTSAFEVYSGENLAARADAVVVSFNYRLATLGFLYSDEVEDITGNAGLWDQALALEWVQENIRYFGGDPNQVTIMGQSAGGWSVSLHILSPVSRGLYNNAILLSGAAFNGKVVAEPKTHVNNFLTGIRKVGCATEDDQHISAQVVSCLENLEAEKVDQIVWLVDKDPADLLPLVVVDGTFLPAKPTELLQTGNYKTDVKLLSSIVEDEGSFIYALMIPTFKAENPDPLPLETAKAFLHDFTSNHYLYKQVPKELLEKVYYSGLTGLEDQNEYRKRTGVAFGDLLLGCPVLEFSKAVFKNAPTTATVYQWFYTAKMGNPEKLVCTKAAGACHCDELYPIFGLPHRHPEQYVSRERDISTEVINFIASFARSGSPGTSQPEWKPFFLANNAAGEEVVVAPYYQIDNEPKNAKHFKFNLKQLECDLLWNHYN